MPAKKPSYIPFDYKDGRPTKLTKRIIGQVCQWVRLGASPQIAAGRVGVHRATLENWYRSGEEAYRGKSKTKEGMLLAEFFLRCEQAACEMETDSLYLLDEYAKGNRRGVWQVLCWRLERHSYLRWGRKDTLRLESDDLRSAIGKELGRVAGTIARADAAGVAANANGNGRMH